MDEEMRIVTSLRFPQGALSELQVQAVLAHPRQDPPGQDIEAHLALDSIFADKAAPILERTRPARSS